MTFLPIVERELRVASRRGLTYWGRFAAGALAILIFTAMQTMHWLSKGMVFNAGEAQFAVLKWLGFAFACAAGMFLTADCLSEEKREGTLGLLFLTDLRGHDVVLGKLISNSARAFYGLIATLPVLALTMILGGVSGMEFWRATVVVCNTLFLTLAIGLLVSSLSRDTMKAMNGALLIVLLLLAGLPFVDWGLAGWDAMKFQARLSLASPAQLFGSAASLSSNAFWTRLGAQHALAWALLVLSCVATPRSWKEKASNPSTLRRRFSDGWRFGGARDRAARRRRLLARDPILWLAMRDRWLPRLAWSVCLIAVAILGGCMSWYQDLDALVPAYYLSFGVGFALELWVASQAVRFFTDATRYGAVELILVAPVTPAQIIRSQWTALWRTYLPLALLVVVVRITGGVRWVHLFTQGMSGAAQPPGSFNFAYYQMVSMIAGIMGFVANLFAVAWFGMWMGLTTRKTSTAVMKTLVFVLVLPWLVLMFAQGSMMGLFMISKWPAWMGIAVVGLLNLGKDVFFANWARRCLLTRFREVAASSVQPFSTAPPRLPASRMAPNPTLAN